MKPKKLLILLPDGVSLRNFVFTSFVETGKEMGWEIIFWNQTPFDLSSLGYSEIKLSGKSLALTDIIKRAKISAELDHFSQKFQDPVYQDYKFPPLKLDLKQSFKNKMVSFFAATSKGEKGIQQLRKKLKYSERKSAYYKECRQVLTQEKPDFVFCTNQRPVNAIAPLTAAQDLGIPTGSFIFSWDNLPKATMVVEPKYYFVWSEHMKRELLNYYPYIPVQNIFVTGTPQFEPHFDQSIRKGKEEFYSKNDLDPVREYLCFSGDDITTSPHDPQYLSDVADAVADLNSQGFNLGIIFRRCPVDFSNRYDQVLENHKELIKPIVPKWKQVGPNWNTILPTKEDLEVQVNTILHSSLVVNLGSSMVFDFALLGKPCLFLNYDVPGKRKDNCSTRKIYDFVHFRSMPSRNTVFWIDSLDDLQQTIKACLKSSKVQTKQAQEWFRRINLHPPQEASSRIWRKIDSITNDV